MIISKIERGEIFTLRRFRFAVVLVLVLGLGIIPMAQGAATSSAKPVKKHSKKVVARVMPKYQKRLAAAVNRTRRRYGRSALKITPALTRAARVHSQHMARKGCLSHSSPCGTNFATRIKRYFGGGQCSYFAAGENLFWARAGVKPRRVISSWLASPSHRSVLLSQQWRAFGIGVVHAKRGPGVFEGRNVVVVTADFAVKH
jgi:uncharacterized protein YkwD